jgi:hypothetical protein
LIINGVSDRSASSQAVGQKKAIQGAPPPLPAAGVDDSLLKDYIHNLQVDINDAFDVITAKVAPPAISCKVANAPTITPITVVMPAGSTSIAYPQAGGNYTYSIDGGTPPYMSMRWAGAQPTCLAAVIHSPNTLYLSPVTGVACTAGETYSFDIYDSQGQHMAQTLQINIK